MRGCCPWNYVFCENLVRCSRQFERGGLQFFFLYLHLCLLLDESGLEMEITVLKLRWVVSGALVFLLFGFINQSEAYAAVCDQSTIFPSSSSALVSPLTSPKEPLPNIDLRHEVRRQLPHPRGMSPQRYEQAMQDLQVQFGQDVQARWIRGTGQLRSLRHPGKLLSSKRYRKARVGARRFLRRHADLLGMPSDLNLNWKMSGEHALKRLGVTHVTFQWYWQDIPVVDAALQVDVDQRGRVVSVSGDIPSPLDVRVEPKISAGEAVRSAVHHVTGEFMGWPEVVNGPQGPTQLTTVLLPSLGIPDMVHQASLVVVPLSSQARVAWDVRFHHDWHARYRLLIDAETGEVLARTNLVQFNQPQGSVFPVNPDVGTATLQSFVGDLMASPQGWLETTPPGMFSSLRGNNTCTQEDRDGSNTLGYSPVQSNGHFDFSFQDTYRLSNGTDVDSDLDATLTNAFYHVNAVHDYFYHLGFDEDAGNFQANNFGKGGFGGDEVHVDAQDRWDLNQYNNAFFFTPADSSSTSSAKPRLDLRVGRSPQFRNIDLALSRDIIIHEYTHGVSCRLVGGPTSTCTLFGIQSGALGEGWSDWFAAHTIEDPVFGEYLTGNQIKGLRRYALNNNPLTYGDLCATGCQVHRDGEIWSATLWDLRGRFIQIYGEELGRNRIEQLVVDGMTFTPNNPSMLDARDGILAADQAAGEVDQAVVWEVFACRGLGLSAESNGASDTSPVEAFDLPDGGACPDRAADVSVIKTATVNPMVVGQPAGYQIVVSNAGPESATQVVLDDVLPNGLTLGTMTWSQGFCSGVATVHCDLGNMAAGASATVLINVTPTATGTRTNTATVQALGFDPTPSNNSSTVFTPVYVPLTVTLLGDGSGSVMSNPTGLSCVQGSCSGAFPVNTFLQLTPDADLLSLFEGWSGDPDCDDAQVQLTVAVNCSATFTRMTLDVDGNGASAPMTDGNLIIRYMKGLRGNDLVAGVVDSQGTRSTAAAIEMYLNATSPTMLDVDQNSLVEAQTDGLLILRFLFGLRGETLVNGLIGQGAVRETSADIEIFLTQFLPA